MKKYYLHNGTEQQGVFDIEELKARKITRETPIWYDGLPDWTPAGKVEELKKLFETAPPHFGNKQTPPPPPPKSNLSPQEGSPIRKKSSPVGIILTVIGALGAIAVIAAVIINNQRHSGSTTIDTQTYQEKVMTVEEMEQADPAKFLDASGTYRENFWGDAMKVQGTITNNATVANYKDVVVEVIFYSSTDTELDRKRYTIYDFFPAHTTKTFNMKIERPQACKKLGWNAVSATPY